MTSANRFEIVAPLPSPRRHLHVAVDRGSSPPRAVVLALYPPAVSDDAGRLARLAGEMERAAQLFHPNILAPVGIEPVGDALAAVTIWRDAVTLRELLDAGGPLAPDLAARIAADVCAGIAHAHGRPQPVVHGLLGPEAVLLDGTGTAAVSGFGMPGGSGLSDDLRGVGELLHECLAGEPPGAPASPLDVPGVPAPLAALADQARAAEAGARHATAAALGAAIAEAGPLASREAVAAYVEAIVPAGKGPRAERRSAIAAALAALASEPGEAEEISDGDIISSVTPPPGEVAASEAAVDTATAVTAAITTEAPAPSAAPTPTPTPTSAATPTAPPTAIATVAAATAGPEIATATTTAPATTAAATTAPATTAAATTAPARTAAATTAPATMAATEIPTVTTTAPATAIPAAAQAAGQSPAPVHQQRAATSAPRVPLGVALAMSLGGIAVGFALARLLAPAAVAGPPQPLPKPAAAEVHASAPAAPAEPDALAATPPRAPARPGSGAALDRKRGGARHEESSSSARRSGTGVLEVTAPDGAEVWLDGRRIGTGNTRRRIAEGKHRVEVRHGGAAVAERFHLFPGETWTYSVTPQ